MLSETRQTANRAATVLVISASSATWHRKDWVDLVWHTCTCCPSTLVDDVSRTVCWEWRRLNKSMSFETLALHLSVKSKFQRPPMPAAVTCTWCDLRTATTWKCPGSQWTRPVQLCSDRPSLFSASMLPPQVLFWSCFLVVTSQRLTVNCTNFPLSIKSIEVALPALVSVHPNVCNLRKQQSISSSPHTVGQRRLFCNKYFYYKADERVSYIMLHVNWNGCHIRLAETVEKRTKLTFVYTP